MLDELRSVEGSIYLFDVPMADKVKAGIMFVPAEGSNILFSPVTYSSRVIIKDEIRGAIEWASAALEKKYPGVIGAQDRDFVSGLIVMRVMGSDQSMLNLAIRNLIRPQIQSVDDVVNATWDPIWDFFYDGKPLPDPNASQIDIVFMLDSDGNQTEPDWNCPQGHDINITDHDRAILRRIEFMVNRMIMGGCRAKKARVTVVFGPQLADGNDVHTKISMTVPIDPTKFADMDAEFDSVSNALIDNARSTIMALIQHWLIETKET